MNRPQLEQLIRDSLTQSPETHVHMLAARIRELEAQVAHAIPTDRVLGEGMLSIHPDVLNSISDTLREIGDTAHNASTGPAVPDLLWEIRGKAYEAYIVATDAEAEITQAANAQDALSALRANQGGAAT